MESKKTVRNYARSYAIAFYKNLSYKNGSNF